MYFYSLFFLGPLLKKILEDSQKKMNEQSTYQLHAYAGHDSTISNLLMALGVWDQQIPSYNILTLIELHESKRGVFYFKVTFQREKFIFVVLHNDNMTIIFLKRVGISESFVLSEAIN